ncbi:MAG TPA: RNA polymerase sigma-70 factor [Gemmatimonadales bacterium]|nr:RNA polymerase sigma-70 factor [Gemmatimonadales bacterium]
MTSPSHLAALKAGDSAVFEQIFREHYARLVSIGDRLLRDPARSEDLAQDVLLELWRGRSRLDDSVPVSAYLYRAVRNRALNELRHRRVVRETAPRLGYQEHTAPADLSYEEKEQDAAVRRAIAELPERCREVFELSRVDQLSYAEIAEVMGITIKTVEAHMGKALRALRVALGPWLPEARGRVGGSNG